MLETGLLGDHARFMIDLQKRSIRGWRKFERQVELCHFVTIPKPTFTMELTGWAIALWVLKKCLR